MNKTITSCLILLGFGFSPLFVTADVIPPNSHSLERCAKVVNLDMFPEILLIGIVSGPISNSNPNIILQNNECISKGYKFNSINIHWNTKDQSVGINNSNLLIKNMDVYGGYINDNNSLIKETVEYSVVKSASGQYSLQKTKVISEYSNGTPNKVESFLLDDKNIENKKDVLIPVEIDKKIIKEEKNNDNQINNNELPASPVKKSFWHRIACFFGINRTC